MNLGPPVPVLVLACCRMKLVIATVGLLGWRSGAQVILSLVPAHWCMDLGPRVSGYSVLWVPITAPAHWCLGPDSWSSSGQGHVQGCLWAQKVLRQPICWWVVLDPWPVNCLAWDSPLVVPIGLWQRQSWGLRLMSLRMDSKMVLAFQNGTSIHVVEQNPSNGCHWCLCPRSEPQLPPAPPGDFSRSASRSGSGPFQLLLLPWVLECMRFCVCPLWAESLFPIIL